MKLTDRYKFECKCDRTDRLKFECELYISSHTGTYMNFTDRYKFECACDLCANVDGDRVVMRYVQLHGDIDKVARLFMGRKDETGDVMYCVRTRTRLSVVFRVRVAQKPPS